MGTQRKGGERGAKQEQPKPPPPKERKPKVCPDNGDPLDPCLPGGFEED